MARITTVLDRPQVLDGVSFPAGTGSTWEGSSHRRVVAAHLPSPTEVLGVRATNLRRMMEGRWIVSLVGANKIDGWVCAAGEVEPTTAGRLWDCRLSGAPSWRGWDLPERTSVQPRPDLHAHSDDCSHRFRSKPATCSDPSQPGIPMIPAG